MSRFHPRGAADAPPAPDSTRRGPKRSIYEDHYSGSGSPVTVVYDNSSMPWKLLGIERDGVFEPVDANRPCCPDPTQCHRPECWTTIKDGGTE